MNIPERRVMAVEIRQKAERLEIGAPKALFQAINPAPPAAGTYDVSADGRRFLFNTFSEQPSSTPITLVTNWAAGLKK